MQGLARFVMQGRLNAAVVALVCSALPLLNFLAGAVVALVTLRRGAAEGGLITLAAIAPVAISQSWLQASAHLAIVAVYVAALVLRQTINLPLALICLVAGIAGLLVTLPQIGSDTWQQLETLLREMLTQQGIFEQLDQETIDHTLQVLALQQVGMFWVLIGVAGLLIGRYWQAALYNPGGFQKEFHALRMPPMVLLGLYALVLITAQLGNQWQATAFLFLMPALLAGLGWVHWWVKHTQAGVHWLVLLYLSMFLSHVLPVIGFMISVLPVVGLMILALLDSFFDLRKRVSSPPSE